MLSILRLIIDGQKLHLEKTSKMAVGCMNLSMPILIYLSILDALNVYHDLAPKDFDHDGQI